MGLSNAERQRRYITRLKERAAAGAVSNGADARIRELEAEVAALKADLTRERTRTKMFETDRRHHVAPKPAKAERPPLPPDEERERIIKGLKTTVKTLRFRLKIADEWRGHGNRDMNFATMSAIAKCLHPEHVPSEDERTKAMKLFTAWKADRRGPLK